MEVGQSQPEPLADHSEVAVWPYGVALAIALAMVGIHHNQSVVGENVYDFAVSSAYLEEQMDTDDQVQIGTQQKKYSFAALAVIACYLAFIRKPLRSFDPNVVFFLILLSLGWVTASYAWSLEPQITIRELIRLYVICLTAYGIARCYTANQALFIVLAVCSASVFAALASEAAAGALQPWRGEHRLQGGMHANMVAIHAAMMGLAALSMIRVSRENMLFWILLGIAVGALWITKSRSATGVFLVAAAVQWSLNQDSERILGYWAWLGTLGAILLFVLSAGSPQITRSFGGAAAMGRNENLGSLSGRLPLWQAVTDDIMESPAIGYGYKAFWTGERRFDIFYEINWSPTDAHSIYFNTVLEQGFVGLLLNVLIVLMAAGILIRARKETGSVGYAFFASLLAFACLHGLTETGCSEARIGGLSLALGLFLAAGYPGKVDSPTESDFRSNTTVEEFGQNAGKSDS